MLAATAGYSQRHYVGLSFGGSLPREEFASKSLAGDGGYALPGFVVDFSAAYIFDYHLGIAGTFTFSSNPPDRNRMWEDIHAANPGPPTPEVNIETGNWLYSNLMAGPILTIPVWKLYFDLRGVTGISFLMSPPLEIKLISGDVEYFEKRSGQTVNFAYMLGTGIRINVKPSYAIRLSADYFRSKASLTVDANGPTGSITGTSDYEMNVGTINLEIGIAYRF